MWRWIDLVHRGFFKVCKAGGSLGPVAMVAVCWWILSSGSHAIAVDEPAKTFRAGAATAVITPELGGAIIGGFHPFPATHIHDDLHARCIVLDDGEGRVALVVCDLLGMHRRVSDEARRLIAERTGIPSERVLISGTHTHSATSALGADLDTYQSFVARRIADGVQCAVNALRPAELGVGACDAGEHVFNRRWEMRPGTMPENPFGNADDLVKMNPPAGSPNLLRPAGPTDPTVSFLALREPDGPPIAVYTAYSLHYVGGVGAGHVSADYFAIYCDEVARALDADRQDPPFVALMANGTSGDINNINFLSPRPPQKPYEQMRVVGADVAARVAKSWLDLEWTRDVTLDARYREPPIGTRRPTDKELAWAEKVLEQPPPAPEQRTLSQIYADRVQDLSRQPEALPMPLQVLRIGPVAIGSMPCEVLCEIGLEYRARSPIQPAFLVSIAHGYYGYLPTPRQHDLGGYETWPGTNKLERQASEKMLSTLLDMTREMSPTAPPAAAAPSPAEILGSLQHDPAVVVELVASEPHVVDPVALCFDERGRLFVAEMRDYPVGPPDGEPCRSRIVRLEDTDHDGTFERAIPFAESLPFVNGLQPWKGGLIVTLAGAVEWLVDADDDGRCDTRETWFTGFAQDNSQLRANHPTLGPDGLVYVANGLRGGAVVARSMRFAGRPEPLSISGRDFRFDPHGRPVDDGAAAFEAVTGNGQFGLCFDPFGNRFICSNRNPCVQVMLEDVDVGRNPAFTIATAVQDVSPAGEASRLKPLSKNWTTSNLHAGQFSAACGVTITCGDGLPSSFRGDAYTCDPTANLVHRQRLTATGPIFSVRPDDGPEFLASSHDWFRPVALAEGPDGCLYVADMCRAVIEHPDFMPTELKHRPDLMHGDMAGRIWRVRSADAPRRSDPPPHADAPPEALVERIGHADGWHRETACRLLLERPHPAAISRLREGVRTFHSPQSRARAAMLLASLPTDGEDVPLDAATLRVLMDDPDPRARRVGARLTAKLPGDRDVSQRLIELTRDADAGVRFEVALRLGDRDITSQGVEASAVDAESQVCAALAAVAMADCGGAGGEAAARGSDWVRLAVMTSSAGRAAAILEHLLSASITDRPALPAVLGMVRDLSEQSLVDGSADRLAIPLQRLEWDHMNPSPIAVAALEGVLRGVVRNRRPLEEVRASWPHALTELVDEGLGWAVRAAGQPSEPIDRREAAIRCLAHAPPETAIAGLGPCLSAGTEQSIRLAAIAAASRFDEPAVADWLLEDARSHTPQLGRAATAAVLGGPRRAGRLLEALESGNVPATQLSADQWKRLAAIVPASDRGRVEALVAAAAPADRLEVIERYRAALALAGDPHRGRLIFTRQCAGCHQVGDIGVNVGPDISDSRVKEPAQYLTDILDPNRAIDSNSFAYSAILTDGRVVTGLVAAETGASVTLRQPDGIEATLARSDIESLQSTGASLMPTGLERVIGVPEMADLVSFLKNWRYDAALGRKDPASARSDESTASR